MNDFSQISQRSNARRHIREITQNLSVDLDANIAAEFVFDENYWKRRCVEQFLQRNCHISEHGLTWKQLFFETYVQTVRHPAHAHEGVVGQELLL